MVIVGSMSGIPAVHTHRKQINLDTLFLLRSPVQGIVLNVPSATLHTLRGQSVFAVPEGLVWEEQREHFPPSGYFLKMAKLEHNSC